MNFYAVIYLHANKLLIHIFCHHKNIIKTKEIKLFLNNSDSIKIKKTKLNYFYNKTAKNIFKNNRTNKQTNQGRHLLYPDSMVRSQFMPNHIYRG